MRTGRDRQQRGGELRRRRGVQFAAHLDVDVANLVPEEGNQEAARREFDLGVQPGRFADHPLGDVGGHPGRTEIRLAGGFLPGT